MTTLNHVLGAIADPTRRSILARLADGPARISDVAAPFPMSLTGFCKHVRILEHAGLVKRARHGRENTLALSARPLQLVAEWVLNYEQFWDLRMDRLDKYFAAKKEVPR
ncbi:MAG: metalloregulator ArsR/SmtB family transcription factor [Acidobacteriaceae bacterium]